MKLYLENQTVEAVPGKRLLDYVRELGLDDPSLGKRPLAAKMAGEIFTLNYIPVREKDAAQDTAAMRRAMAASDGNVRLLRYGDPAGQECYIRTAQFLAFLALRNLWPQAIAKMDCTLGASVYISVENAPDFRVSRLKAEITRLVSLNFPLIRRRVSAKQAAEKFRQEGQTDKARLLAWRSVDYFDEYYYGDYSDYFYGEMAPSSGYLTVWDVLRAKDSVMKTVTNIREGAQDVYADAQDINESRAQSEAETVIEDAPAEEAEKAE